MKKYLKLILIICFFIILSIASFAEENREVEVQLNQKKMEFQDAQPLLIKSEGRTIVPLRCIAEQLEATVHWNKETKEAYISLNDKVIILGMDNNYAMINGNKIAFDSSARLINQRTYVPLRFVSEALECSVDWDDYRCIVHITTKGNERPIILPNTATGDMNIDEKALLSLDSNFIADEWHGIYYLNSDGSQMLYVRLNQSACIGSMSFDESILQSSEKQNVYKKVLKFYFRDKADEAWNFILKMHNNKKTLDEFKEIGNRRLRTLRPSETGNLIIFID